METTTAAPGIRNATKMDAEHEFRNGRASDRLRESPNEMSLGTPMQEARLRAIRFEKRYGSIFKVAIWAVLLAGFYIVGLNTQKPHGADKLTSLDYRMKAARLAPASRVCELDRHEGCLVCMHKDASGMPSVSTHC